MPQRPVSTVELKGPSRPPRCPLSCTLAPQAVLHLAAGDLSGDSQTQPTLCLDHDPALPARPAPEKGLQWPLCLQQGRQDPGRGEGVGVEGPRGWAGAGPCRCAAGGPGDRLAAWAKLQRWPASPVARRGSSGPAKDNGTEDPSSLGSVAMMVFHGPAGAEVTSLRPRPGDRRLESELGGSSVPGKPVWACPVSEMREPCGWVQCTAMCKSRVLPRTKAGASSQMEEEDVGEPHSAPSRPVTPLCASLFRPHGRGGGEQEHSDHPLDSGPLGTGSGVG